MSSTQGFHVIMNLFLIPMWFLSGAMFPADGAKGVMRWLMSVNPLTYGVSALRRALYLDQLGKPPPAALVRMHRHQPLYSPLVMFMYFQHDGRPARRRGFAIVVVSMSKPQKSHDRPLDRRRRGDGRRRRDENAAAG